jgi:hypothetical protein
MKRFLSFAVSVVLAIVALAPTALAHGHLGVGDKEFSVGWADEPAFAGQLNAVQLLLEHDGKPVLGLENTLRVIVSVGGKSSDPMKLHAAFDSPGEYRADLIPTVPGGYTFRFVGKVSNEKVDQSFTAPKDGFDEVEGTTAIAFPNAAPTNTELAERSAVMQDDIADAKSAASLPRTLAVVGIVLGVVAIGLSLRPRT